MSKKKYKTIAKIKNPLRKKQKTKLESFRCPKCKYIIILEKKPTENKGISCPSCGQKNIFKTPLEQQEKKYEESHKTNNWLSQISFNAMIIGLILIFTSILILFIQNPFTTKLGLTLLIIGTIVPLFIIEKEKKISLKITFGTIIYIIILFSITAKDLEIFLILIFLGVLITKTVIDEYIPKSLKIRMNLFISVFFIIFIILIIKKIINLVGI